MTIENMEIWNKVKQAPSCFLKPIAFGHLKGKSDISPQWRLMAMTQAFGNVGHGWTYRIVKLWSEVGADGQIMAFAEIAMKTKLNGEWGEEFSGIGGSMIAELAKGNVKSNDEGYKMAVTDALGVAMKAVGVAADIYLGSYDGSKYRYDYSQAYNEPQPRQQQPAAKPAPDHLFDDNGIRILRPNEFEAALLAVKNGRYNIEDLTDAKQYSLSPEQLSMTQGL